MYELGKPPGQAGLSKPSTDNKYGGIPAKATII
jgi:hypothetical protein